GLGPAEGAGSVSPQAGVPYLPRVHFRDAAFIARLACRSGIRERVSSRVHAAREKPFACPASASPSFGRGLDVVARNAFLPVVRDVDLLAPDRLASHGIVDDRRDRRRGFGTEHGVSRELFPERLQPAVSAGDAGGL